MLPPVDTGNGAPNELLPVPNRTEPELATTSSFPSPFTSPSATLDAAAGSAKSAREGNAPDPLFKNSEMLLMNAFAVTMSGLPSSLNSPNATSIG